MRITILQRAISQVDCALKNDNRRDVINGISIFKKHFIES
jgi:hypothetical protein